MANAWRLKVAGLGGVVGFELDAARRTLIAGGTDPDIADALLTACEAAAVRAYNEKDDPDGGED